MEGAGKAWNKKQISLPALASILFFFGGFILLNALFYSFYVSWIKGNPPVDSLFGDFASVFSMLAATLIMARVMLYFERRSFMDMGFRWKGHAHDFFYGAWVALLFYTFGFILSLVAGGVEVMGVQFDFTTLLAYFLLYTLVAVNEEVLIRGYILGRLLDTRLNKFVSLLISSALFAALHLGNPNLSFLPMLNLLLAGLLLGSTYLYTRNLWFPIGLHLFWNWIQGPILGYEVSGIAIHSTVFTLHLPHENLLSGGAFGFEGSLLCTLLIALFISVIIYREERTFAKRPS